MSGVTNGNSTGGLSESIKILILGVIVYLSPSLFFRVEGRWLPELRTPDKHYPRVIVLRRRFWKALATVLALIVTVLGVLCLLDLFPTGPKSHLRVIAAFVALTATLGRGGRAIETFTQETVIERIDRGMFVISQLGTTVLLLVALGV